jgi:hypothetical protein
MYQEPNRKGQNRKDDFMRGGGEGKVRRFKNYLEVLERIFYFKED